MRSLEKNKAREERRLSRGCTEEAVLACTTTTTTIAVSRGLAARDPQPPAPAAMSVRSSTSSRSSYDEEAVSFLQDLSLFHATSAAGQDKSAVRVSCPNRP